MNTTNGSAMSAPSSPNVLVIVESPTKARTIANFLSKEYTVMASHGHVRDLPASAEEVPGRYKNDPWAELGVNIDDDFWPLYVIPKDKKRIVTKLRKAVKAADRIYFATDEDREGESIAWHLCEVLSPEVPWKRIGFHEITENAIQRSLNNPRDINLCLVQAQETRRIVDRLVGYEVSRLLWKKITRRRPSLSAGRVQSPAVRILIEQERARMRFESAEFWGMKADFARDGETFNADLLRVGGERVATSNHFNRDTGKLKVPKRKSGPGVVPLDGPAARRVQAAVEGGEAKVASVVHEPFSDSPKPPYVTSTLQQEANSKLRFGARRTMSVAQKLYENGFITYMRTDSTVLSNEAKTAARKMIAERFGAEYLPERVRDYRNTAKNAQEAHEAIRPAGGQFRAIREVRSKLGSDAARLYEMIWRRTLASQMRNARGTNSTAVVQVGQAEFRATGKTTEFAGYLRAYVAEGKATNNRAGTRGRSLPALAAGDSVDVLDVSAFKRNTKPPKRYREGTLIRDLDGKGIGRPSTWASIVNRVQDRNYAFRRGGALIPTFIAMAVVGLMEKPFSRLVDYAFTAWLEDQLDTIARCELKPLEFLADFYSLLRSLVKDAEEVDPRSVRCIPICETADGTQITVCIGRYGPFLSDGNSSCSVPGDLAPDELDCEAAVMLLSLPRPLGRNDKTGKDVTLHIGRHGLYVECGTEKRSIHLRISPFNFTLKQACELDLETALKFLSLPRSLGMCAKSGEQVIVRVGSRGPYLKCGDKSRSIPDDISPFDITLEQACELLDRKKGRKK